MPEPFAQVPIALLRATYRAGDARDAGVIDKRRAIDDDAALPVSDRAVRLYAELANYAGANGQAFPSRTTLARLLGCSHESVDRATKELVLVGFVKVRRRRDQAGDPTTNLYEVAARTRLPSREGAATPARGRDHGRRAGAATGSRVGAAQNQTHVEPDPPTQREELEHPADVIDEARRELAAKKQRGETIKNERGLLAHLCQQIEERRAEDHARAVAGARSFGETRAGLVRNGVETEPGFLEELERQFDDDDQRSAALEAFRAAVRGVA